MIANFKHRGLKRLYERGDGSRLPADHLRRIRFVLGLLDTAQTIGDMDIYALRLHQLKGDWNGCWAVTVRAQWRIVFRFEDGEARDVDYVDYHN